jgi:hypothetical protein
MDPSSELLKSPILLFVILILGLLGSAAAYLLSNRLAQKLDQRADLLTQAAKSTYDERRARALEIIAEKLPPMTEPSVFADALDAVVSLPLLLMPEPDDKQSPWPAIHNLIDQYHRQALNQAFVQFWISIVAAFAGFALIAYLMLNTTPTSQSTEYILRILPGAIVEVLAALFFKQATETRDRATAFYDRLRSDNQQRQSLEIATGIQDNLIRSTVEATLALHMAGLNPTPPDPASLLSHLNHQQPHTST